MGSGRHFGVYGGWGDVRPMDRPAWERGWRQALLDPLSWTCQAPWTSINFTGAELRSLVGWLELNLGYGENILLT